MRSPFAAVAALSLSALLAGAPPTSPSPQPAPASSCGLIHGPIRVEVTSTAPSGASTVAELQLTARVDVGATRVALELPHGGQAAVLGRAATGALRAGETVHTRVAFTPSAAPAGDGAIGYVHVEADLPQPDGSVERATSAHPIVLREGGLRSTAERVAGPRGVTLDVPRKNAQGDAR